MSIHSFPVLAVPVSPLATASPAGDNEAASSDARWAAWVERTRQHDRAFKRKLRLGLLTVGDVMIGAVNAEVFNPIAQRLKRESPYKATMMATLTNGSARSGYIPDDASYAKYTFEVLSSRLRPGCAEAAIVNGLLELMDESRKADAR